MLGRFAQWIRSWAYAATADAASKRDLRIDLLRGFCVFVMIVDHVGGETSWLYVLTGGDHFIVSAAEGFVLVSGFSMGLVHRVTIQRHGVRATLGRVFGRARFLYLLTVLLTMAFASVSFAFATPWSAESTPARSRTDFVLSVLTLHRSYSLTDVLVLYTLLVAMAAPILALLHRGYTGVVLATSFTAWVVFQVSPARVPRLWSITDGGFPFSAWQLLFVLGLVLGFHRHSLERYFTPSRLLALAAGCALAIVAVLALHLDQRALGLGTGAEPNFAQDVLLDKNDARIGRIVGLMAVAPALYALATIAWAPLRRVTGGLLLPMGQRALFAYSVQLFVVAFLSSELFAPVRLDRENALFQAMAVLVVWAACMWQPAVLERAKRLGQRLRGPVISPTG